jgi:hypothetical protein
LENGIEIVAGGVVAFGAEWIVEEHEPDIFVFGDEFFEDFDSRKCGWNVRVVTGY